MERGRTGQLVSELRARLISPLEIACEGAPAAARNAGLAGSSWSFPRDHVGGDYMHCEQRTGGADMHGIL
eukprot:scaffold196798_cov37-Tisochrysis_lutea.AAC.3